MSVDQTDRAEIVMPSLDRTQRFSGELSHRLYATRNLDDGFGRGGYGPELLQFIGAVRGGTAGEPSLATAVAASTLCDRLLASVTRR